MIFSLGLKTHKHTSAAQLQRRKLRGPTTLGGVVWDCSGSKWWEFSVLSPCFDPFHNKVEQSKFSETPLPPSAKKNASTATAGTNTWGEDQGNSGRVLLTLCGHSDSVMCYKGSCDASNLIDLNVVWKTSPHSAILVFSNLMHSLLAQKIKLTGKESIFVMCGCFYPATQWLSIDDMITQSINQTPTKHILTMTAAFMVSF